MNCVALRKQAFNIMGSFNRERLRGVGSNELLNCAGASRPGRVSVDIRIAPLRRQFTLESRLAHNSSRSRAHASSPGTRVPPQSPAPVRPGLPLRTTADLLAERFFLP